MNLKKYRMLLVLTMAPFILLSAVPPARAEDGYWKLEKGMSQPNAGNYQTNSREFDEVITTFMGDTKTKMGTAEVTWTKLPNIVIPGKKYSVTVNSIMIENHCCYWNIGIYFNPRGYGDRCVASHAGSGAGGLDQGPQTCTYELPKGTESGKSKIEATVQTTGNIYYYTYIWYSGPPPADAGGTTSSGGAAGPGSGGKAGTPGGGMALRVDKVKASSGETVSVPVFLDNSTGLANVNFNLIYDVRKVVVGNTEKGSLVPATTSLVANPRQAGMVRVGLAGSQDITGSGILVKIPFKAVGPAGGRADLKLAITTKGSASGGKPAVQAIDGWIEIGGPGGGGGTGTGGSSTGGGTTGTGGTSTGGKTDPGVKPKPPGGIPGDVNGNGRLEAIDALQALKMSVGLIDENLIADVDGDGHVTSTDARLILTKVVGK